MKRHAVTLALAGSLLLGSDLLGAMRPALIRRLAELRHTEKVLRDGAQVWLDTTAPDSVIAFKRCLEDGTVAFVFGNVKGEPVEFRLSSGTLPTFVANMLSSAAEIRGEVVKLGAWGYWAVTTRDRQENK